MQSLSAGNSLGLVVRVISESRNEGETCEHGYSLADIFVKGKILEWQRPSAIG